MVIHFRPGRSGHGWTLFFRIPSNTKSSQCLVTWTTVNVLATTLPRLMYLVLAPSFHRPICGTRWMMRSLSRRPFPLPRPFPGTQFRKSRPRRPGQLKKNNSSSDEDSNTWHPERRGGGRERRGECARQRNLAPHNSSVVIIHACRVQVKEEITS